MRRGLVIQLSVIVALAVGGLLATLIAGNRPLLGLDLQGGVSVVLQPTSDVETDQLDQAIEIIRNRVDGLGVAEPDIARQGDSIVVQLPGVDDAERALELVGQTAELRFREVIGQFPNTPDGAAQAAAGLEPLQELFATPPADAGEAPPATTIAPDATSPDATSPDATSPATTSPATTAVPETTVAPDDENSEGAVARPVVLTQESETTEAPATTESPATTVVPETTVAPDTTEEPAPETTLAPPTTLAPVDPESVITGRDDDTTDAVVLLPGFEGEFLYVLAPAALTGEIVDTADAQLNPFNLGDWQVNLDFTSEGSPAFDALAAQTVGRQLAIVLDGVVYSAPVIQQPNFGGTAVITGNFDEDEAKDLATVLRFGALPIELEPATVQTVSATLGSDALSAGVIAGIVGLILVGLFMTAYYRLAGLISILGLAVSGALLWSTIAYLGDSQGLALTLAGATGIIVSIGVQVDSNVVYYERLKEEMRRGRSLRVSADAGFQQAFSTIVKADVASLIGAGLLYWLTVGPVRGFALFLGLATILDLVVSYFFMRPALVMLARRRGATPRRIIGVDVAQGGAS
ncbi:MAG: protein translocase subunit SecD [Actinomycetota bacterium]